MGTKVRVSLDEYLSRTYEPDCDYSDGELIERNVGEKSHSRTQGRFFRMLADAADVRGAAAFVELRIRLGPERFRIPDVVAFLSEPLENVPSAPPLLALEIVSPDDRLSAILVKLEEFRVFGVPHIWLADPQVRALYTYGNIGLHQVPELQLPELELLIRPADVF